MKSLVMLAAGLLVSTAAVAQVQGNAPAESGDRASGGTDRSRNVQVNEKGERLICRVVVRSESRMSRRRECRTREEWNDVADRF